MNVRDLRRRAFPVSIAVLGGVLAIALVRPVEAAFAAEGEAILSESRQARYTSAEAAAYPGGNGLLIFEGWGGAGYTNFDSTAPAYDLWTMAPDGSGLTNITNTVGVDTDAHWSPDGNQITFGSNRTGNYDIYVMRPDGTDVRNLTSSPGNDTYSTWSPNGRRIAYVSERGLRPEIIVMRADGTKKRSLGRFSGSIWGLEWSPVAPELVFVHESSMEGHYGVNDDEDVLLLNARTGNVRVLADDDVPEFSPGWSPDGRFVAYSRYYCKPSSCDNLEIVTIRRDGSNLTRITETPRFEEFDPEWSPDGTKIAYVRSETDALLWDMEIFVMNADGSEQRQVLTRPDSLDYAVDWQRVPPEGS